MFDSASTVDSSDFSVPLEEEAMGKYLKNVWYMAAWSNEVGSDMLARKILNTPVVLFRDENGKAAALFDTCPHRFAPLSTGVKKKGGVQCRYHGLTFDRTGKCTDNPLGGTVPAACRVTSYPVVEKDTIIWIWMGDPAKVDESTVPFFPMFTDPEVRVVYGYSPGNAHYQLYIDNLMDLTHASFLHPGFGYESPKMDMEQVGNSVISRYLVADVPNPVFPGVIWPTDGKNVDLRDDITWTAPATLSLESWSTLAGLKKETGIRITSAHIMTPESDDKTHYFWASDLPKHHPIPDDLYASFFHDAFDVEDKPMIQDVHQRMAGKDFWSLKPVLLSTDGAAIRVRRIIDELISTEEKSS